MDKMALLSLIFSLCSILPAIAVGYILLCRVLAAESRIAQVEMRKQQLDAIDAEQLKSKHEVASALAKVGALEESLGTLNNKLNARARAEGLAEKRKKDREEAEKETDEADCFTDTNGNRIPFTQQTIFPVNQTPPLATVENKQRRRFGELKAG